MTDAYVGEAPIDTILREWVAPDDASERELARAATEALLVFCEGWIEPFAIEMLVGCYDRKRRDILDDVAPQKQHWLLRREILPDDVELRNPYLTLEVADVPRIDRNILLPWVEGALDQDCPGSPHAEPTVLELRIPACQVKLPPSLAHLESLVFGCYAGSITVPVETEHCAGWIAGPRAGYAMHPPVSVRIANDNGALVLDAQVYWSPWRDESHRVGSDLFEAVRRLEQRDWSDAFR